LQPDNAVEYDMVVQIAQLSHAIERGERIEMAHLAGRVRMAARLGPETGNVSAEEIKKIHELGSKLFFQSEIAVGRPDAAGDSHPAVIVHRLEESAEGCRWLLARWAELGNVVDRKAAWTDPEIVRILGLLGKRSIEAYFDPELNSLFHAFDVLGNRIGHKFWNAWRDILPVGYKGGFMSARYREIALAPSNETEALSLIRSVIEKHAGRLQELLAEHKRIGVEEAAERYDRAALDCSPEFERHQRSQSAKARELLRTLDTLCRMRNSECGKGKRQMANARWQMTNARWRASFRWRRVAAMRGKAASRWQRNASVRSWDTIPIVSLMLQ